MSQQQFVKNTNVPDRDSYLWSLGNNWRISGKTNEVYCPLKYEESKEISDLELFTAMKEMIEKPIEEQDYVEYEGFYFLPSTTNTGDRLLYAYDIQTEKSLADKRLANIKKYGGQNTQQQQVSKPATTVAKPVQQQQQQQNRLTNTTSEPEKKTFGSISITTFTDPVEVSAEDKDTIKALTMSGLSILPSSLVKDNHWREDVVNENGEIMGTRHMFLMGKIINVKITDI